MTDRNPKCLFVNIVLVVKNHAGNRHTIDNGRMWYKNDYVMLGN